MNEVLRAMNTFSTNLGNITKVAAYMHIYVICKAVAFYDQQFIVKHLF